MLPLSLTEQVCLFGSSQHPDFSTKLAAALLQEAGVFPAIYNEKTAREFIVGSEKAAAVIVILTDSLFIGSVRILKSWNSCRNAKAPA